MKTTLTALLAICLCWAMGCGEKDTGQPYKIPPPWRFEVAKTKAETGDAEAQFNLALMYNNGIPEQLQKNDREAAKWYRKAAEQGHVEAQFNLGLMYDKGEGVRQDFKEAAKWFRKAAEQGHASAQYNLGVMYD